MLQRSVVAALAVGWCVVACGSSRKAGNAAMGGNAVSDAGAGGNTSSAGKDSGANGGVAATAAGGDGVAGVGGGKAGEGGGEVTVGGEGGAEAGGNGPGCGGAKCWSKPILIEDYDAGNAGAARVAVNAKGVAVATWSENDPQQLTYRLRSNRYDPVSKRWGTPQPLTSTPAGSWIPSSVAVDVGGNATAVWQQQAGVIRANRYDAASSGWGADQPIAAANTIDASAPGVAMDAAGNAIAVWRAMGIDDRYNIYANRYDAQAKAWASAGLLETASSGFASFPSVAVNAAGNALAVWSQNDGSHENIYSNRYDAPSNKWGGAKLVETDNNGDAYTPQVGIDASGNALAVWTLSVASVRTPFANRYDAGSAGWGEAVSLGSSATDGMGLAVNASGAAVALGWGRTGIRSSIWAKRYLGPADGWSDSEILADSTTATFAGPAVAVDPSGNAMTVWVQTEGQLTTLWARWYNVQVGGWAEATPLGDNTRFSTSVAQVAMDGSGNATAVWSQSDGKLDSVWASRFE